MRLGLTTPAEHGRVWCGSPWRIVRGPEGGGCWRVPSPRAGGAGGLATPLPGDACSPGVDGRRLEAGLDYAGRAVRGRVGPRPAPHGRARPQARPSGLAGARAPADARADAQPRCRARPACRRATLPPRPRAPWALRAAPSATLGAQRHEPVRPDDAAIARGPARGPWGGWPRGATRSAPLAPWEQTRGTGSRRIPGNAPAASAWNSTASRAPCSTQHTSPRDRVKRPFSREIRERSLLPYIRVRPHG
jgi:hypothetical protein